MEEERGRTQKHKGTEKDTEGAGRTAKTVFQPWVAFLRQQKVKEPSGICLLLPERIEQERFKDHL